MELAQNKSIDFVGLHLGMSDGSHLQRIGDHNALYMGCHVLGDRKSVPRSLDDYLRFRSKSFDKGDHLISDEIETPETTHYAIPDLDGFCKVAMDIKPHGMHGLLPL